MKPSVVILCGGRGTRLQEHTQSIPKPLVEIGGRPILWHVIQIYVAQGFRRFLLLTGYLGEQVIRFVEDEAWPDEVEIRCLDTGQDTPTGGRLHLAADELRGSQFCLTYADGVADVDLDALLAFHAQHGATATMTVVQPELPFGVAQLAEDGAVKGFVEKPRSERWINGGFFCFRDAVFDALEPDSRLESQVLVHLAQGGGLRAYRHAGFWECMDTYKDAVVLNDLWKSGGAPWKLWS
ncbi:MAG TPA: sugar phosphate nucleotidyltransferase [Solirubrobacteraceae bacterium]